MTAAQCAKRMGLTVRALRVYEQIGLIRPLRTGKNWRLYGPAEIARLNEVLTLKRLGLSLPAIANLLRGKVTDFERMLAMQKHVLEERQDRVQASLALVAALAAKVAAGDDLTITDLLTLAKDGHMTDSAMDAHAWRRYEQARPRTERAIDPALFHDYAGFYQLDPLILTVFERDGRLFARITGQPEIEIFAEGVDHFFYRVVPAQLSFERDAASAVSALILHQDGFEQTAPRVEAHVAAAIEAALEQRVAASVPVKDGEGLLQRLIEEHQQGELNFSRMTPPLAALARTQHAVIQDDLQKLGSLEALTFRGVTPGGWDVYEARFENGRRECGFALASNGKISGLFFHAGL
ncbi:MerR family transcriptional regulator [Rhizobium sp. YIM 134829]|uniref:MerR family transcriptional regulator n=1 Tax=Rhizobium sp. YIM 134829 TaxID=3390453 RepID=UPI00397D3C3D